MKHIGNISPSKGSVKGIKRIGRGAGSGHGGTSTRGHKGHSARLQELVDTQKIHAGDTINLETLRNLGVVRSSRIPVKVLGNGELSAKLNVSAAKFTESAKGKIELAGGTAAIDE